MHYAAIMPIENYNVTLTHGTFGLHTSYQDHPELLGLLMLCTTIPYDYELGLVTPGAVQVQVKDLVPFYTSLDFKIQTFTVADMVQTLTPLEFYEAIEDEDLAELPIAKTIYESGTLFKMVVGARAAQWGSHYRGIDHTTDGKLIKVNFGGARQKLQIPSTLTEYNEHIIRSKQNALLG